MNVAPLMDAFRLPLVTRASSRINHEAGAKQSRAQECTRPGRPCDTSPLRFLLIPYAFLVLLNDDEELNSELTSKHAPE